MPKVPAITAHPENAASMARIFFPVKMGDEERIN